MPTLTVEDMEVLLAKARADVTKEKELREDVQRQLESVQNGYRVERSALENRIAQLRADYEELLNEFRGISTQMVPIPEADAPVSLTHRYLETGTPCGVPVTADTWLTRSANMVTCPRCRARQPSDESGLF